MDTLDRLIDERVEAEFGWMRCAEITTRAVACVAALAAALALALGLWQPSTERVLQCALALALSWTGAHLLRSIVGAMTVSIATRSEHLHG